MTIQEITRYKYDGKEYDNLTKVRTEVEGRIGSIIDQVNPRLTAAQALDLMEVIIKHKADLIKLLNVNYENNTGMYNILDL